MNLLLGRFLPYIAGGLVLALLVTTGLWRFEAHRVTTVKGERDAALHQVTELTAAVSGKDSTIAALQASAEAWQKLATPAEAMKAAADRVDAAAQQIEARSRALTPAEVKDHANPDCAALLAMDIARMCPGIAAGVRERAAHRVPGQASSGPSTSGAEGR